MLTNEILSSIDNIDDCVMEAEMNVLNALCNEYDKAIMIMENYNGDSYDCFDIFQEGFKDELNKPIRGVKGENILKRILMAIPRLIALLIKKVKKFFNKEKSERIVKNLETIKRVKVKDLNKLKIRRNKKTRTNNTSTNPVETVLDNNDQEEVDLDKGSDSLEINNMVEDLVEKKVVKSNLKFDVILKYFQDCHSAGPDLFSILIKFTCMPDALQKTMTVDDADKWIGKINEYMTKCKNKAFMQHKTEKDVREYITSQDKQEYSIDKTCRFISEQKDWLLNFVNIDKYKTDVSDHTRYIKTQQDALDKHPDDNYCKVYIHELNTTLKIYQQLLVVLPIVSKIINEETDKWDEATKRAVGLLNEED